MKKFFFIASLSLLGCQTHQNPANCVVTPGCPSGQVCDLITETCQVDQGLTLTSIEPRVGSQSASTMITISGTGFQSGITVQIGGSMATSVNVVSSTQLTALAPASAAYCGPVNVHLANPDNTTVDRADLFRYSSLATPRFTSQVASASVPIPTGADQIIITDLDGDKREDLAIKSPGGNALVLCAGNNTAVPTCNLSVAYSVAAPSFMRIFDFEHNRRPDILVASQGSPGSGKATLLRNPGAAGATWTPGQYSLVPGIMDLQPVDRDTPNGTITDLYVATATQLIALPFAIGGQPTPTVLATEALRSFRPAQLDPATAAPELVAVRSANAGLETLEQDAPPTYSQKWSSALLLTSLRIGDVNADGQPDLIGANDNGALLYVALGQGDGRFATPTPISAPGVISGAFEIADLYCDGNQGLVVATAKSLSYMKGHSDGTFAAPTSLVTAQTDISAFAVKDLTGDGRPELVYVTSSGGVTIAQNNPGP